MSEGRERSFEQIDSVAQGRIWSGEQARERGLVDAVGGLGAAIAQAKELADIPASDQVGLLIYPKGKTFLERLKELAVDQSAAQAGAGLQQAFGLASARELLQTLTAAGVALREGPGRPLAVMPFVPRIH